MAMSGYCGVSGGWRGNGGVTAAINGWLASAVYRKHQPASAPMRRGGNGVKRIRGGWPANLIVALAAKAAISGISLAI